MGLKQKKRNIDKFIIKLSKKLSFCIKKDGYIAGEKIDKFNKWIASIDKIVANVPVSNDKIDAVIREYYNVKIKQVNDLDVLYTNHEGRHTYGFLMQIDQSVNLIKNQILSICTTIRASTNRKSFEVENRKVFVVHGRDIDTLEQVSNYLSNIGLEPVILKQEPKKGGFILQRFIELANECNFALVLLTPDDKGSLINEEIELKRARQNVIFELGYFISLFGVERVLTLYDANVDLPSDLLGRFYIEIKDGWKEEIIRELEAMGYKFVKKKNEIKAENE